MSDKAEIWSHEWRTQTLEGLQAGKTEWDIIVVGGGITGAGVYREATRLGLKVLLLEQQDFAWGTSSRSSKMVHGGLRYLGSGQFGLANDSVKQRQELMNELPGLVNPLPFMMGHYKGMFPGPWIFDKLLAIYDYMAGKRYRRFFSKGIRDFLVPGMNAHRLKGATQFSDAVTDDARLVLRVLHEGNHEGGVALNYVKAVNTIRENERVSGVAVKDQVSGELFSVRAKVVINATGAWTDELRQTLGHEAVIRPLRGSHLVVPFWRLPTAFSVSFFHGEDKRPVFVFPWEGVSVIGTTDLDHKQDSSKESAITPEEVSYLLAAANYQFPETELTESDVRSTWSGVRPVISDSAFKHPNESVDKSIPSKPSDEKREHAVWDDQGLISVAGGKLTTYRLIANDVLKTASKYLSIQAADFKKTSHFECVDSLDRLVTLSSECKKRLLGRYGRHAEKLVANIDIQSELAQKVGDTDTLWAELVWACQAESVQHLDDLLLRRTRIGLLLEQGGLEILSELKPLCQRYMNWDESRWEFECERYLGVIKQHYSLPESPQDSSSDVAS